MLTGCKPFVSGFADIFEIRPGILLDEILLMHAVLVILAVLVKLELFVTTVVICVNASDCCTGKLAGKRLLTKLLRRPKHPTIFFAMGVGDTFF